MESASATPRENDGRYVYSDDPGPPPGWRPGALAENPLLDLLGWSGGAAADPGFFDYADGAKEEWALACLRRYTARRHATRAYAWAVPHHRALHIAASYGPIVEVCAGRGYWAALLRLRGADVIATDAHAYDPTWTTVEIADAADAAAAHPERALMLVWPPYDLDVARRALAAYRGRTVIYVGEGHGGCTGDDAFHEQLASEWEGIDHARLPQWYGIHDDLTVYRRRT